MADSMYNTEALSQLSAYLRKNSPVIGTELRKAIAVVGRSAATRMRDRVPHQSSTGNWGTSKGVHFSSALAKKGGAIVIDHLAFTFGVGQPPRYVGKFKHKVFGNWSSSPKTVMPVDPFIIEEWAKVDLELIPAADEAIRIALEELVTSDLGSKS